MEHVVVVGIGADGMPGLSARSRDELLGATTIFGSPRQLGLLDETVPAPRRAWPTPMLPALRGVLDATPGVVHVVASGDPMLHGIGSTLVRLFGAARVRVLPHVSSAALACARMGWPVDGTEVVSLVTAAPPTAVRTGGRAVVLSRDASTPSALARVLTETGRGDSLFTVLEQLGGPRERRRDRTAAQWASGTGDGPGDGPGDDPGDDVDPLNVIAIEYRPDDRVLSVLPDDAFAHDGQITKQSIRAVTLAALAPRPGELLWDVGSGSGSVAVEWCRSGAGCRAVAFERDPVRRARITDNAAAYGAAIDVRGAAPADFGGAAAPAAVFVGGGLTQPGLFDACLAALPAGGRLVANAVTAESEAFVAQRHGEHGGRLQRFQHYLGEPLGSFTGWRPAMPVTQWALVKP